MTTRGKAVYANTSYGGTSVFHADEPFGVCCVETSPLHMKITLSTYGRQSGCTNCNICELTTPSLTQLFIVGKSMFCAVSWSSA